MSRTLDERVHAAILEDVIGQADRHLDAGLRGAAAIVTGAALEQHLRQLAARLDVAFEIPDARGVLHAKPAQRLNDDLRLTPAYPHSVWQQVQHWLETRDLAARGELASDPTTEPELRSMAKGVRDFIRRHPA